MENKRQQPLDCDAANTTKSMLKAKQNFDSLPFIRWQNCTFTFKPPPSPATKAATKAATAAAFNLNANEVSWCHKQDNAQHKRSG